MFFEHNYKLANPTDIRIKVTPFCILCEQPKITFKIKNNYYSFHKQYCGIVTQIKKSDDWLGNEIPWVSRSEIPFITALRHGFIDQKYQGNLVSGLTNHISKYGFEYTIKVVPHFPNSDECRELLTRTCRDLNLTNYKSHNNKFNQQVAEDSFNGFKYNSNLLIRIGACLYKANVLLDTSFSFAEEIYINASIAFEGLIEYLKLKKNSSRKRIIDDLSNKLRLPHFEDYEEKMRDDIRNNIIHPYRYKYKEKIAIPYLIADDIFEDLGLVDWLFMQVLSKKF